MPSNEEISKLAITLLQAVLSGRSLPGQPDAIRFPDLAFFDRQPFIFLKDMNLPSPIKGLEGSPKPIRILSADDLTQAAKQSGDVAFFQFQPPEISDDEIRLTLEARIATQDPSQKILGLSSIYVKFKKVGGEWVMAEEPIYLAS